MCECTECHVPEAFVVSRRDKMAREGHASQNLLSDDQRHVLQQALLGKSMFVTGCAGCGKSLLLQSIVLELRTRRRCVYVTASTGIAALNIGGTTIHSFAGSLRGHV